MAHVNLLIQLATLLNLFPFEIVQKYQYCQLRVFHQNIVEPL